MPLVFLMNVIETKFQGILIFMFLSKWRAENSSTFDVVGIKRLPDFKLR
jgi:hypothetical protein